MLHHRMIARGVECTVKPVLKMKGCQCKQAASCLRSHLKMRRRRSNHQMNLMLVQIQMLERWKIQLRTQVQMMHH